MKLNAIVLVFFGVLFFSLGEKAYAEPTLKPVTGEVVAVDGEDLKLKTESGVRTIMLARETLYQSGDKKATVDSVKPGDHVTVIITRVEGAAIAEKVTIEGGGSKKAR